MKLFKNTGVILFAVFLLFSCQSQKKVSELLYDKYNGTDGFSLLILPPNFVNQFVEKENTDQKELLSTIKDFRIMTFDNRTEENENGSILGEINELLAKRNFEEYLTIYKDGSAVSIKAIEENGVVREMHVLIGGEDKLIMASIIGKIDMSKVNKTIQELDFNNLDNFNGLKEFSGEFNFDDLKIKL